MRKVESEIIVLPHEELKIRDDLVVLNEDAKQLAKAATEWRGSTPQGKHRAMLLTKKNRMDKQMKLGQVLEEKNIITPDEVKQFSEFEQIFSQMQRARKLKPREFRNYKIEQQFRHIPGTEKKANCKAGKRHSSNNPDIQNQIEHVRKKHERGPRGSYKKKYQQTAVTPSPQAHT